MSEQQQLGVEPFLAVVVRYGLLPHGVAKVGGSIIDMLEDTFDGLLFTEQGECFYVGRLIHVVIQFSYHEPAAVGGGYIKRQQVSLNRFNLSFSYSCR